MKKLIGGIFVTVKELQSLCGLDSRGGAGRLHKTIRDCLGKTTKYLTVNDFCKYTGAEYRTVVEYLNGIRHQVA